MSDAKAYAPDYLAVDVFLAVEQLVGRMPLVVSVGFMPPSIVAVILGCLGFAEQVGRVGCLAIGPSGTLVPSGGALMLAPAFGALEAVGHSGEPTARGGPGLVGAQRPIPRYARARSPVRVSGRDIGAGIGALRCTERDGKA